jgi:hypothetical protein
VCAVVPDWRCSRAWSVGGKGEARNHCVGFVVPGVRVVPATLLALVILLVGLVCISPFTRVGLGLCLLYVFLFWG